MKYPKEYLDEIKLRLKVSQVVGKTVQLKKMIKQRNESCEVYEKAGRRELLENEKKEINVISTFLPKQLSEEDTKKICQETIKSIGASSMKDIGKIMGALKTKHADSLDFSKVSKILRELLKCWYFLKLLQYFSQYFKSSFNV